MIVHQSKTEEKKKKNFLLNWLYIHGKKNHNLSLSLPLLRVSWCQLSPLHQCLHLHAAIGASSAEADPKVQFIWRTDNTPKSFINPHIMYSIGTIRFQRANSLESRPDLFSLWSLTACFIFGYHPCRLGWVGWVGGGGVSAHIFLIRSLGTTTNLNSVSWKNLSPIISELVLRYTTAPGSRAGVRRILTSPAFLKLENIEINEPLTNKWEVCAVYWLATRKVLKDSTKFMRKRLFFRFHLWQTQ